jgi:hypothetical protein
MGDTPGSVRTRKGFVFQARYKKERNLHARRYRPPLIRSARALCNAANTVSKYSDICQA